jgi:hypothetical protein
MKHPLGLGAARRFHRLAEKGFYQIVFFGLWDDPAAAQM